MSDTPKMIPWQPPASAMVEHRDWSSLEPMQKAAIIKTLALLAGLPNNCCLFNYLHRANTTNESLERSKELAVLNNHPACECYAQLLLEFPTTDRYTILNDAHNIALQEAFFHGNY